MKLPDLRPILANCDKARSFSVFDGRKLAHY